MGENVKIGIIICDRYRRFAGGKCFRSLRNREGAFGRYGNREVEVVYGTYPIPQKYLDMHDQLGTWQDPEWQKIIQPTLTNEETRLSYD